MHTTATTMEGDGAAVVRKAHALLRRFVAERHGEAFVTLAYAQSLDGCIAAQIGCATRISGAESLVLTHGLRAIHDAILIGVNTVLVDDPQLNVRLVNGPDPRPVVVDSRLRISPDARIFKQGNTRPIIATTVQASSQRAARLVEAGAEIVQVQSDRAGQVDLHELFARLPQLGIGSVMIEGGAGIITSTLASQLAHQLVLTISPTILGGVRAVDLLGGRFPTAGVRLANATNCTLGGDLILHGEFEPSICKNSASIDTARCALRTVRPESR
jgi:3,4-dihydroxy 2-butanone 4-phosphate synthase/GTP cyclohydrolase II